MSLLSYLECTYCNKRYNHTEIHTLCDCGKVLYSRYDLENAKETVTKASFGSRKRNIFRIGELMPVGEKHQITLGEGMTPMLYPLSMKNLMVKDEGFNPTGSFKARGLCSAVSKAYELGITKFVIPTAGNAGAAMSAYCAAANLEANVFMPKDAPSMIINEVKAFGANLNLVDGLISDAGRIAKEEGEKNGWFDVSTLKEPYRVEGKKTMGFEIAEQLNWKLPQVIIYPTGGGTGIVGIVKAFEELETLGLISKPYPRMIAVQTEGCAPIIRAFQEEKEFSEFWENASTIASGLRVPKAIGDYLILHAIRETHGLALTVSDNQIRDSMKIMSKQAGIFMSPEAAATHAAYLKLLDDGQIESSDTTLLLSTASGLTTPRLWN